MRRVSILPGTALAVIATLGIGFAQTKVTSVKGDVWIQGGSLGVDDGKSVSAIGSFGISNIAGLSGDNLLVGGSRNLRMKFVNGGSEKMVLNEYGRLGIGTSNPGGSLHIRNGSSGVSLTSDLIVENSSIAKLSIFSGQNAFATINLGGLSSLQGNSLGVIEYQPSLDKMTMRIPGGSGVAMDPAQTKIGHKLYVGNLDFTKQPAATLHVEGDSYVKGSLGIGTSNTGSFKLAVEGTIGARCLRVTRDQWADFVFDDEYQLPMIEEVASYIKENKRLPGIPSEEDVLRDGLDVGDMHAKLLQKVEELTLYVIELKDENKALQQSVQNLQKSVVR